MCSCKLRYHEGLLGPIYGIKLTRNYLKIEIKVYWFFVNDLGINNEIYMGGCGDLY